MKSVLISIQPKWCELIASGKKTVEVRKTRPKLETPFKVYIYCSDSSKDIFYRSVYSYDDLLYTPKHKDECKRKLTENGHFIYNGKVIGEFVCNQFTYIEAGYDTNGNKHLYNTAFIEHRMCIPDHELHEYLYKDRDHCGGWAWHISDLLIYDQPKELSEFYKCGAETLEALDERVCTYCSETANGAVRGYSTPNGYFACEGRWCDKAYQEYLDENFALIRPPQSWCYVEEVSR